MDNFTAAVLTLIVVSPSIVVLSVLVARGIREAWETCAHSARAGLKEAMCDEARFEGKLCGGKS